MGAEAGSSQLEHTRVGVSQKKPLHHWLDLGGFHGGIPNWMVYFMENPASMDNFGGPIFRKPQFVAMKLDGLHHQRNLSHFSTRKSHSHIRIILYMYSIPEKDVEQGKKNTKKWDGEDFSGMFVLACYELIHMSYVYIIN